MNSKLLVVITILILLLGGGAYVMSTKNKSIDTSTNTNQQTASQGSDEVKSGNMSLKDLLTSNVPQKCTYSGTGLDVESSGTSFISGGKVRVDYIAKVEGQSTSGHMIYDGATSYIWNEEQNTGFKMAIDKETFDTQENTTSDVTDFNKSVDYNCTPWVPDGTLFTPPANVTFTEFAMPTVPAAMESDGSTGSGNQDLCKYCDSLTGDQKTQCLTSLKCN